MEDRKFALLFAATILAARKLSELEAQGITRPCPARDIIIIDAISKAEEIMRKIEKNYPPR
jgi:nucleoside-triphosphatase THEP1